MSLAHFLSWVSHFENIGSLAGIVEHLAMYPVDTIKVRNIVSILWKDPHAGLWVQADLIYEDSKGTICGVRRVHAVLEGSTSHSYRVLAS